MSAFFNNPEMLRNARILRRSDVTGPACRVDEMAQRLERVDSRISCGEVM